MEKELTEKLNCISLAGYIRQMLSIPDTDIKTYSPLTLAYIGDAVYEMVIRTFAVESGNAPVNKLHRQVIRLVQASAQAEHFHRIQDMLTQEEMSVYKRGRNAKSYTSSKNTDIVEYRTATGVEALVGYLYLTGQTDRMLELIKPVFNPGADHEI
jgi:ribonuclease-3 family protein